MTGSVIPLESTLLDHSFGQDTTEHHLTVIKMFSEPTADFYFLNISQGPRAGAHVFPRPSRLAFWAVVALITEAEDTGLEVKKDG